MSSPHGTGVIRGSRNAAGRHSLSTTTIDRIAVIREYSDSNATYTAYHVAVDTGDVETIGWRVPAEVFERAVVGAPVEAVISGDGRYLYSLEPLTP